MPLQKTASVVVDIGDLDVSFDLEGALRFDHGAHRLYVKPMIVGDVQGTAEGSPLRLSLLTDMEYPIPIQKLVPGMTGTEGRPVGLDLSISDVFSEKSRREIIPDSDSRATSRSWLDHRSTGSHL